MAPKRGSVSYPKYRKISPKESAKLLRQLELEAYASVISALRSQGDLSKEKKLLLSEICACLGITEDRHKAEIRRAVNDEKLATIALHNSGKDSKVEWIKEGRRTMRVPHRPLRITKYMEEADKIAEIIAAENAALPEATEICVNKPSNRSPHRAEATEKPLEVSVQCGIKTHSSLYCIGCLSQQNELVDVSTSTDDLNINEKMKDSASMSDDCVYLPNGTVVQVSAKKIEKEEKDAYSMDSNMSGNYDFGNAPEINLTGSKGGRRKRKKSIGYVPPKEGVVTIRKVIKPNEEKTVVTQKTSNQARRSHEYQQNDPSPQRQDDGNQEFWKKHHPPETTSHSADPVPRKKKKSSSQTATIQHTPVPPEHLYAVGAGTVPKSRQAVPSFLGTDAISLRGSVTRPDYTVVSAEQSPTKHLGMFSNRPGRPLSPTYTPGFNPPPWSAAHDPAHVADPGPPYHQGFSYSPTKPTHRPQKGGAAAYSGRSPKPGHSRKYRSSPSAFSFAKRPGHPDYERQKSSKRATHKKEHDGKYQTEEIQLSQKLYQPAAFTPTVASHYLPPEPKTETPLPLPRMQSPHDHTTGHGPQPHSSTLEELASVSLMASGLSGNSIVETGLAPVSAIVSRVTSPAPGQVSSAPAVKKSVSVPMVVSKIHSEESLVQLQKVVQPSFPQEATTLPSRQLSVVTSSALTSAKLKLQGPASTVANSNPVPQARLTITGSDSTTVSSVPISFTSALPHMITSSSSQMPRVISTVAGKSHALLKSSTGNVITVTAKPLASAVRSSVPTIVSGASIVKPQIGQKTSIIVVHKAPGSKIGKSMPTNFPSIGPEGSKVITVSTKNLSTQPTELPKYPSDSPEETSESALGSIQGLVSGLNPTAVVKKAKVVGMKPKFITMPLHKKPVGGKIGEPGKTRIIQNIIKAPGKVLVKTAGSSTLAPGQLRSIPSSKIVKPVVTPPSSFIPELQNAPSHDIVAAALSQSLGASVPAPNEGNVLTPETPSFVKVATSTPAASTIKAIAASYQKNSSTNQPKQIITTPMASGTSSSHLEKPKVFLTASHQSQAQSQPMLFTPNQPQIHRSPQSGSIQQRPRQSLPSSLPKSGFQPITSTNTFLASVSKPSIAKAGQNIVCQPTSQPPIMQVKVLSQPTTTYTSQHHISTDGRTMQQRNTDDMTTPIMSAYSIGSSDEQISTLSATTASVPSSDRTTFIYQYHSPSTAGSKQSSILQGGSLPLAVSSISTGDMITLHSVEPDGSSDVTDAFTERKSLEISQSRLTDSVADSSTLLGPSVGSTSVPSVLVVPESFSGHPPHSSHSHTLDSEPEQTSLASLLQGSQMQGNVKD